MTSDNHMPPEGRLTFKPRPVAQCEFSHRGVRMRLCPHCYEPMREFNFAYDSNVFLDRCEKCRGIWLDKGEIMQIAQHIQYDPEVQAAGRAILHLGDDPLAETEKQLHILLQMLIIIMRFLIFRT